MSEVKVFKLSNGAECIAKVISSGAEWVIDSPVTLQPIRQQNELAVGLIPFSFGGKNNEQVVLSNRNILCVLNPDPNIEAQYRIAISGLVLPTEGPKLTLV